MPRANPRVRETARALFLSGEASSNVDIARHLKVKPHTVAAWRKLEGWDDLRIAVDRRAAEKLVEEIATGPGGVESAPLQVLGSLPGPLGGSLEGRSGQRPSHAGADDDDPGPGPEGAAAGQRAFLGRGDGGGDPGSGSIGDPLADRHISRSREGASRR
jgi:hypothetical protein